MAGPFAAPKEAVRVMNLSKIQNLIILSTLSIGLAGTTGCVSQTAPAPVVVQASGANPSTSATPAPQPTPIIIALPPRGGTTPMNGGCWVQTSTGAWVQTASNPGQQPGGLANQVPAGALIPVPGGYVIQPEPLKAYSTDTAGAPGAQPPVVAAK